jgi:hypothetical protein
MLSKILQFLFVPLGWSFLLYIFLQVYALYKMYGSYFFWLAFLPLLLAVYFLWGTYEGLRLNSNLWPMPLIIGGPILLIILGIIGAYFYYYNRTSTRLSKSQEEHQTEIDTK